MQIIDQKNYGFSVVGVLSEINVKVGNNVKKGDVLAKIENKEIQSNLNQANYNLKIANNNYNNRYKNKYSEFEINNFKEEIKKSEDKLNSSKQSISKYTLISKHRGFLKEINSKIRVGGAVNSTDIDPYFIITDKDGHNPKQIFFEIDGKISEINKKIGDEVQIGDKIAKLDDTDILNIIKQDESALNIARNNYTNALSVKLSENEESTFLQELEKAKEQVKIAKENLEKLTLKSDIDGIVYKINYKIGDSVPAEGTNSDIEKLDSSNLGTSQANNFQSKAFLTVINKGTMRGIINASEIDIPYLKIGQKVSLKYDAILEKSFEAEILNINNIGQINDKKKIVYPVEIKLNNLVDDIKSNMFFIGEIFVENKQNTLTVPNSAIMTDEKTGQKFVKIISKEDTNDNSLSVAERRDVQIGITSETKTEIIEGLTEGELIVTNPSEKDPFNIE